MCSSTMYAHLHYVTVYDVRMSHVNRQVVQSGFVLLFIAISLKYTPAGRRVGMVMECKEVCRRLLHTISSYRANAYGRGE